jgi:hypothetical protein
MFRYYPGVGRFLIEKRAHRRRHKLKNKVRCGCNNTRQYENLQGLYLVNATTPLLLLQGSLTVLGF